MKHIKKFESSFGKYKSIKVERGDIIVGPVHRSSDNWLDGYDRDLYLILSENNDESSPYGPTYFENIKFGCVSSDDFGKSIILYDNNIEIDEETAIREYRFLTDDEKQLLYDRMSEENNNKKIDRIYDLTDIDLREIEEYKEYKLIRSTNKYNL